MSEKKIISQLKELRRKASKGLKEDVRKVNECPSCFKFEQKKVKTKINPKGMYDCKICGYEWY